MTRRLVATVFAVGALAGPAAAAVQVTPVARLPFPERGFVVDLPGGVDPTRTRVEVRENGILVPDVYFGPTGAAGLRRGVVVALDASDSMRGAPFAAALAAARRFAATAGPQDVRVLAFNDRITSVARLDRPPALAYGTHLYDALDRALSSLARQRYSSAAIVVLSDGADVGSTASLRQIVDRARRAHVRVFAVGLHSAAYAPGPLRLLAQATGGTYSETARSSSLASIFGGVGARLAHEYLVQYRSLARPGQTVTATIAIQGAGAASATYAVPQPSGQAPFHRSALTRFLLSPFSLVVLALGGAGLAAAAVASLLRRPPSTMVARLAAFTQTVDGADARGRTARTRPQPRKARPARILRRLRSRLAFAFEVAEIQLTPGVFLILTAGATVAATVFLASVGGPFVLLAVLVPLGARAWVGHRVHRLRSDFADQTPETLQLLASAVRTGHSFVGALGIVTESAADPMRRELRRVVTDERLGVPLEVSLREVAGRMASPDFAQVALLSELQRTAGGNTAEVLEAVVETVRERADVRRLAKTLTAQGRLARWVLTLIPFGIVGFLLLTQRSLIAPMFTAPLGQIALAVSALMVVLGSLWIKQIVEIEV